MAGWEWLPEDWILAENSAYNSTLQQRFAYAWNYHKPLPWIHRTRCDRFGRNLCRGLLEDQESRWDTKRLELISSTSERVYQEDVEWVSPPIDARELYVASVDDMISAMNAESPSILQLNILEQTDDNIFTRGFFSPNDIARTWIVDEIDQQQSTDQTSDDEALDSVSHFYNSPIVIERLTSLLEPYRERILTERFLSLLTSRNREATYSSLQIIIDAGLLDHAQHVFLDPAEDPEKTTARKRAMTIGFFSTYLSDAGNQQFYGTLMRLLNSSQVSDLVHALNIIYRVQEYQQLNENSALLQYSEAIHLAVEHSIDRAGSPPSGTAWFYESYHQLALALLFNHDVDGDRIYPFIVQQLLNDPRNALYLNRHDAFSDTNFIKAWIENFAPLVDSDDVAVREWVIINLPVALGSHYDDAIDQIAVSMLDDPERHIAVAAQRKLEQRFAEILILH